MGLSKSPTNKVELIRSIQQTYNPKIETFDVVENSNVDHITKRIKQLSSKPLSIIVLIDP